MAGSKCISSSPYIGVLTALFFALVFVNKIIPCGADQDISCNGGEWYATREEDYGCVLVIFLHLLAIVTTAAAKLADNHYQFLHLDAVAFLFTLGAFFGGHYLLSQLDSLNTTYNHQLNFCISAVMCVVSSFRYIRYHACKSRDSEKEESFCC